jgi:hypothetical protein
MSVNFSVVVVLNQKYEEQDGTETENFEVLSSKLDLGNFRANRFICPINSHGNIDDFGERTLTTDEDINFYMNGLMKIDTLQTEIAYRYITAIQMRILGCTGSSLELHVCWS